jgi:hypothetical protein
MCIRRGPFRRSPRFGGRVGDPTTGLRSALPPPQNEVLPILIEDDPRWPPRIDGAQVPPRQANFLC